MEILKQFIEFLLHAENHLKWVIENYGVLIYVLLFLIIFCETGLVVTPFCRAIRSSLLSVRSPPRSSSRWRWFCRCCSSRLFWVTP